MKRTLIVGGANGIGLSVAHVLASRNDIETVYIIDKSPVSEVNMHPKFKTKIFDLESDDYSVFDNFENIDTLLVSAGFGKLSLFSDIEESCITSSFKVNTIAPIRIISHFYNKISATDDFYCGIMVSIAGFMSSPFFSVYAATKAALKIFIESVNVELEKSGSDNKILNISPGSIKGTSFNNGETDLSITKSLAKEIVEHLEKKNDLFIPQYEEIYREVLRRYSDDFREEGRHSYEYKLQSNRMRK